MNQGKDRTEASGLLNELDDIRSLLDDSLPDDAIPVLEDAVEASEDAIPLLDDEFPADPRAAAAAAADAALTALEAEFLANADEKPLEDAEVTPDGQEMVVPFLPSMAVADLQAGQALQAAIRNRIDETLERWVNETLQQELTLLRSRLLEAVRAEVHEFIATQNNRSTVTESGRPHGE